MFKRTAQGLANEHHFFRVDYVVYCEGEQRTDGSNSLDEIFWRAVFSHSNRKFFVRSIGSKTDALDIANSIINNNIENIIVALDSDYDHHRGISLTHNRIVYSCGYSWESDAIAEIDFKKALSLFVAISDNAAAQDSFLKYIRDLSPSIWRALVIDLRYIASPGSLFDRKKPASIISISGDKAPAIAKDRLLKGAKSLSGTGASANSYPIYAKTHPTKYFFGKTIAHLIYKWFAWFSSKFRAKRNVYYDTFMNLLIECIDFSNKTSITSLHYKRILSSL